MPVAPVSEPPADTMNRSAPAVPVTFAMAVKLIPSAVPWSAPPDTVRLFTFASVSPSPVPVTDSMPVMSVPSVIVSGPATRS